MSITATVLLSFGMGALSLGLPLGILLGKYAESRNHAWMHRPGPKPWWV